MDLAEKLLLCVLLMYENVIQKRTDASRRQKKAEKPVFLVDDDVELLRFEGLLLETENIKYLTFENAEAALSAFMKDHSLVPALIISDFQMGKMNGLQLLEAAKRRAPKLKTMLVSGTVEEEILETASVKIDVFMAKPFPAVEFLANVKSLLGMAAKRKTQRPA